MTSAPAQKSRPALAGSARRSLRRPPRRCESIACVGRLRPRRADLAEGGAGLLGRCTSWFARLIIIIAIAPGCGTDPVDTGGTPARADEQTPTPGDSNSTNPDVTDPVATDPEPDPDPDVPEPPEPEGPQYGEWARGVGAAGAQWAEGIALDGAGNVFVAGSFDTTITIEDQTVTAIPGEFEARSDTFVASYTPGGEFRWLRSFGSTDYDQPREVLVDKAGNVYVVGFTQGDMAFGETTLVGLGSEDVYLISYTNDGEFRWAESFGGPYGESPRAAAINGAGQLVITGSFQGTFSAGDWTVESLDEWAAMEVFTMRYDLESRNVDWVSSFHGFLIDVGTAVDIAPSGDVVVAASMQYDLAIDSMTSFDSGETFGSVIVQLDNAGRPVWNRELVGEGAKEVLGVGFGDDGAVYATGVFEGLMMIGDLELVNSNRGHDTWVARLDDGQPTWATSFGEVGFDQPLGFAVGPRGVYVAGRFDGPLVIGETSLLGAGDAFDVYVASFDAASGAANWARSLGSDGDDQPSGIALDGGSGLYLSGFASGSFTYADELHAMSGEPIDAFVLRMEE